jgi:hypothetical protein
MDIGQWVIIILSLVLAIWYFLGSIYNRRRGMKVFNWLRPGMEQLGKLSEAKWIGSSGSGARLVVDKAQAPFQRVEVIFLLETREILPLWVFNHLRGRRDEIIMKSSLRSSPSPEWEAAHPGNRDFQKVVSADGKNSFEKIQGPEGYDLAFRGDHDEKLAGRLYDFLDHYRSAVWRVSVQRKAPNLILRANLPTLQEKPAEDFFLAIREVFKPEKQS